MDKRLLLASPHMSDEGYELEYIHDAFRKNWIAPLGENMNEFEKTMGAYMEKVRLWQNTVSPGFTPARIIARCSAAVPADSATG